MSSSEDKQTKGTFIGLVAIILWGALALLSDVSSQIPPFQLMAMSFTIGFLVIYIKWRLTGSSPIKLLEAPPLFWLLSIFGLFGYHFCYFLALRYAPVVQAGLVAYLWPLFIVILSVLWLKRAVTRFLWLGVLLSVVGCFMLIWQPDGDFKTEYLIGYGLAFACALIWSSYSVLSAKFSAVPSDFIGWVCAFTAVLAFICHLLLEQPLWPLSSSLWFGVVLLGIGPVGIAFVVWDHGMKHGNVALLGSLSYLAPVISTCLLLVWADGVLTASMAIGGSLVIIGAILAAKR